MNQLRATFGQQDQDLATQALERAFSLTRGKLSLPEYAAEFDQRMEEAADRAGLAVNDVGRFYLFFKNSGLAHRDIDSIKLQVGGDYTRYQDARALALRLANNKQYNEHDNFGGWASYDYDGEDPYSYDDWHGFGDEWQDDEWWSYDDDWYDPYYEDYMTYYEDDGSWLWPEEEEALSGQQDGKEGVASSTQERREDHTQSTEDFYKGGGKGKGKSSDGCFICGSKYHFAADCPMKDNESWRSRSGNQDWRTSYGKGVGKGKGRWKEKDMAEKALERRREKESPRATVRKARAMAREVGTTWIQRSVALETFPMESQMPHQLWGSTTRQSDRLRQLRRRSITRFILRHLKRSFWLQPGRALRQPTLRRRRHPTIRSFPLWLCSPRRRLRWRRPSLRCEVNVVEDSSWIPEQL